VGPERLRVLQLLFDPTVDHLVDFKMGVTGLPRSPSIVSSLQRKGASCPARMESPVPEWPHELIQFSAPFVSSPEAGTSSQSSIVWAAGR